MNVLTDFHHSGLLRATNLLFGDRLGMNVYRPIGMEWFTEGFWAINDLEDTAKQFLELDSQPLDNTPALNNAVGSNAREYWAYRVFDPGMKSSHMACTLEYFKANRFDYVIASIPAHVPLYKKLIDLYSPGAKLIVQMGNNWNIGEYSDYNVLASLAPQLAGPNTMFYHQEIDLKWYINSVDQPSKEIYSFVNVLQRAGTAWNDFLELERILARYGYRFKSYGGQCRDGSLAGDPEVSTKMRESQFVFHVKPGGDGFGHVIHSAYAMGRPVITRSSHYRDQLAEQLMRPGTFIDLDSMGRSATAKQIAYLGEHPDDLFKMGKAAHDRFVEVVDYEKEAKDISAWLGSIT